MRVPEISLQTQSGCRQMNKVEFGKLSKALLLNLSLIIFDIPLKNNRHPLAYTGGQCHQMSYWLHK